jgi:carbon starvation protein
MGALAIMVIAFAGYIIVYQLYGKFIGAKIFALSGAAKTPSVEMEDGIDYVPTKKEIIFGHHFTSIAGTGPLVGPAIAVIWGWVPAMIWVFVGSIVMGAVHDFGALIISMRNQGKSISEYTAKYVNNRTKVFFFLIVFLELWIVIAIFGLVIAIVFSMYPTSVLPVWLEIPIAIYLGYLIYKKGANVALWSIIAVIALYVTVVIGAYVPIALPTIAGIPATGGWTIILLVYAFIASTLPVTTLLQPRDFINSHQLLVAMTLLVLGVLFAGFGGRLDIVAPAVQLSPAKSPPMWPFLFITIACGAISGFHSLVSSGTSAKQVRDEQDSLFVGYGSMLLEGALATLVIIAVSAGIGIGYTAKSGETLTGVAAWTAHYASWASAGGLGNAVRALVDGSANMITTLDTATRIQRYVIAELFGGLNLKALTNRYIATFVAVVTAMILAFATGASGKGAMKLWPLFGATNQTLASLALIIITLYLKRRGGVKWVISGIPAVFMTVMTIWALILNQVKYGAGGNMLLTVINICILIIALWIATEGVIKFFATGEEPAAPAEPEIA